MWSRQTQEGDDVSPQTVHRQRRSSFQLSKECQWQPKILSRPGTTYQTKTNQVSLSLFHTPPSSRETVTLRGTDQEETVQGSGDEQMTFWNRKPGEDVNKKVPELNPRDMGLIEHHESKVDQEEDSDD